MQHSGAAGARSYILFPLLGVLFQGECAGWLWPTSGWGRLGKMVALPVPGEGGLRKAPTKLLGRKEAACVGRMLFFFVITTHSVELVAC